MLPKLGDCRGARSAGAARRLGARRRPRTLRPARRPARAAPPALSSRICWRLAKLPDAVVVRVRQSLRDQPDGADRVVVAGDDVVDQLRIASWCRRSRSPGCRACWPRRRRCTRASNRPRTARPGAGPCRGCRRGCASSCSSSRSSRRRSFFDSMLSLSLSLPSISLSRSTEALMVTKLVSVPPSQRCVTQYWLQRFASSRIDVLRLALGADEEDAPVVARELPHELGGLIEHLDRLLQIDDVDPASTTEDVPLHLRVPATGLVTEVNAGFEQLLHRDLGQRHTSWCASAKSSALAELVAGARAAQTVLLALLLTRVAGQEPGVTQRLAQIWIELGQRARQRRGGWRRPARLDRHPRRWRPCRTCRRSRWRSAAGGSPS